jgi:AcrR family transcriptional regulator
MSRIVSREQYFEAALVILADTGFKGLNIGKLCETLGVTSGSFYHHFTSWQDFVDSFLHSWESGQAAVLRELNFGRGNWDSDIAAMRQLTVGLNQAAEAAIRAWSANDETVREVQRRVDELRRATVHRAVRRVVSDDEAAEVLTSLGMAMLVGYQQLSGDLRPPMSRLLDEYVRLIDLHHRAELQA